MLIVIYFAKGIILKLAFTPEFSHVESVLIWQLLGDFFRIMTLAFGFQILVKTMMKRYFLVEIVFNVMYFLLSFYLVKQNATEGVLQAYFFTNVFCFLLVLVLFRKLFIKTNKN
jgi:PST family polysaccharide transporter